MRGSFFQFHFTTIQFSLPSTGNRNRRGQGKETTRSGREETKGENESKITHTQAIAINPENSVNRMGRLYYKQLLRCFISLSVVVFSESGARIFRKEYRFWEK